mgnify:CR=1 FL=1
MSNSNDNHFPRLEREANEYAASFKYGIEYRQPAYLQGAAAEHSRAAPVVKALEEIVERELCRTSALHEALKRLLETYKADV